MNLLLNYNLTGNLWLLDNKEFIGKPSVLILIDTLIYVDQCGIWLSKFIWFWKGELERNWRGNTRVPLTHSISRLFLPACGCIWGGRISLFIEGAFIYVPPISSLICGGCCFLKKKRFNTPDNKVVFFSKANLNISFYVQRSRKKHRITLKGIWILVLKGATSCLLEWLWFSFPLPPPQKR